MRLGGALGKGGGGPWALGACGVTGLWSAVVGSWLLALDCWMVSRREDVGGAQAESRCRVRSSCSRAARGSRRFCENVGFEAAFR